jgi:YD repeat-containing protein
VELSHKATTSFTYDAFGRVTQTTFPSSLAETYAYDAIGNLTSKTDRKGQTITYLYDALNRLTQKTYPDSTSVEYVYDLVGKVMQVNDPTGTYGFAEACPERSRRDNMGRLIGTTTSYSFLPNQTFTNAYTYDAASNRTGFTAPDGSTNSYSGACPERSRGNARSRRTQLTRPNGVNTNYAYDNLSRLLSVLHQAGSTTLPQGNLSPFLRLVPSSPFAFHAATQLLKREKGGCVSAPSQFPY